MDTATVKIRRTPRARLFEAEWAVGEDRFVVLSVRHAAQSRALIATLRREREERSPGSTSRIYAPFQDMTRISYERVARYSERRAEAYFNEVLARVESVRGGGEDPESGLILMMFMRGEEG